MTYKACHRHARISPRKVRALADMIRGKFVDDALDILRYQPERGARMLEKVLKSALGNAQDPEHPRNRDHSVRTDRLYVESVYVNGGAMAKRVRPRARGMAHVILRRTSHLHVTLAEL